MPSESICFLFLKLTMIQNPHRIVKKKDAADISAASSPARN